MSATMDTHLHAQVAAPHSHTHTPTEVALIITFTAPLLGNSKPTCESSISVSVVACEIKQSQLREHYFHAISRSVCIHILYKHNTETGCWPTGQNDLQGQPRRTWQEVWNRPFLSSVWTVNSHDGERQSSDFQLDGFKNQAGIYIHEHLMMCKIYTFKCEPQHNSV